MISDVGNLPTIKYLARPMLFWYFQLFKSTSIMNALTNTLSIAFLASLFATILGTAAAIGISNFKGKSRILIQNASNIPIISPDIVMGVSLMLLFTFLGTILNFEMGYVTVLFLFPTSARYRNIPHVIRIYVVSS